MESLRITVDLNTLMPVSCTAGFYSMLGYADERACLRSFGHIAHFQGYNLLQISRLPDRDLNTDIVPIIDRSLRIVGKIEAVSCDGLSGHMEILASDYGRGNDNAPQYLPPVTLALDPHFCITEIDPQAAALFGKQVQGESFPEAIAPAGLSRRLARIYRHRTRLHGTVTLNHLTRTSRQEVDAGRWQLTRQRDLSFKAAFQPLDSGTQERNRDGSDSGYPDKEIMFLQPARNRITLGGTLAKRLGIEESVENDGYAAYLGAMVEEDKDIAARVLSSSRLPGKHLLRYRLTTIDGKLIPVEHLSQAVEQGACVRRRSILRATVTECSLGALAQVSLQTLAIDLGLGADGNTQVLAPARQDLLHILAQLSACLAEEQTEPEIVLSADHSAGHCSLCDAELNAGNGSLVLQLSGYKPGYDELKGLSERNYSLVRAGEPASWQALFRTIARTGFHVTLACKKDVPANELRDTRPSSPDGSLMIRLTAATT